MANGVDAQRYNPEVPLEQNAYAKTHKLNELVDKLIKLRHTVTNAVSTSHHKTNLKQNFIFLSPNSNFWFGVYIFRFESKTKNIHVLNMM